MQQGYVQSVPRRGGGAHIVPMNKTPDLLTQPAIVVVPWIDPVVDAAGASLFSRYVELYWLPVLGPSALWILRRIVMGFETENGLQGYLATDAPLFGVAEKPFHVINASGCGL